MKTERVMLYKNKKIIEKELPIPEPIKNGEYEIDGFIYTPVIAGAIPESEEEYTMTCAFIINVCSKRYKNNKTALLNEAMQKMEELGVSSWIIMHDFWDESKPRPIPESKKYYCSECGHELDGRIIK